MLELIGFILSSFVVILLCGFLAFLCFGSIFTQVFEGESYSLLKYIVLFLCGIALIAVIVFACFQIRNAIDPPETIEKDGITYYLTEDKPKEKIEKYGHEYIMRGEKND